MDLCRQDGPGAGGEREVGGDEAVRRGPHDLAALDTTTSSPGAVEQRTHSRHQKQAPRMKNCQDFTAISCAEVCFHCGVGRGLGLRVLLTRVPSA